MHIKTHVLAQHPHIDIACPLCQEPFTEKTKIETHLKQVHNVNSEGLQKLLLLVEEPDNAKMPPMTVREASLPTFSAAVAEKTEVDLDALENESAAKWVRYVLIVMITLAIVKLFNLHKFLI